VASVVTTAVTVIMATNNENDVFYFFHGLFSTALFLSVVFVARALFPSSERQETRTPLQLDLFKLLAFAGAFLFVVSPVTRVAWIPPYSSPEAIWAIGTTVSNHTYQWSNEEAGPGERLTAWTALRGKSLRVAEDYQRPWPSQFRDTVNDFLDSENLSDESPLLFLTSEQLESVSQRMSGPLWATGLAVTAVTGMPLVHGVPDPPRSDYGFGDYDEDALVLPQVSVSEDKLCGFGRPIISVTDIDDVAFKVLCR